MLHIAPVARTAMEKKGATALSDYQKKLEKALDDAVPWRHATRRRASLRGKVKPGEVAVILEKGESASLPIFKEAENVTRE